jgi:hypothetical protein
MQAQKKSSAVKESVPGRVTTIISGREFWRGLRCENQTKCVASLKENENEEE